MTGGTQGMQVTTDVLTHGTPRAEGMERDEGNAMLEVMADGTAPHAASRLNPGEKEALFAHFRDQLPEPLKPLLTGENVSDIVASFKTLQTAYTGVKQEISKEAPPPVSAGTGNRAAAGQMTPGWSAVFGQAGSVAKASPFQKIAYGMEQRRSEGQ